MKKLLLIFALASAPLFHEAAFAQSTSYPQSVVDSLQARMMALKQQRDNSNDELAARTADLSIAQKEIQSLKEQIAKLTTEKPKDE